MGLEPTTFELEVQHASPLRHGGYMLLVEELLLCQKNYTTAIIISWTMYFYIVDLVICGKIPGKIPGNNSGNMCLAHI